ncbi:MAG: CRISPR-associated endonuclease Cas2 [Leptospiraceae bacterium]|nr:CRISPR-associated endonuclease Cas2 [Leptospiraceae bacterium]
MLYLVCYDIPATKKGNKRRHKINKTLSRYGMRVQYSVFEIRISERKQYEKILRDINRWLDPKSDSVRIYPIEKDIENNIEILGLGEIFRRDLVYVF